MENYQLVPNNLELATMQIFANTLENAKDAIQRFRQLNEDPQKIEFLEELVDLITEMLATAQHPKSQRATAIINEIIDDLTALYQRGLGYLQDIGVVKID